MAKKKISQLTAASSPVADTSLVPMVIGGATKKATKSQAKEYDITPAETAAGVTPIDYSVPNHLADGIVMGTRYGAVEGADNIAALNKCVLVAAQLNGCTIVPGVNSLLTAPWVITADDVQVDTQGKYLKFSPTYVKDSSFDWSPFNTLVVANGKRIFFRPGCRFLGNIVSGQTYYFSGEFLWFSNACEGGGVHKCYFANLRYDASNSVAIQTRPSTTGVDITENEFHDCTGSIALQGVRNTGNYNKTFYTDAMGAAPLTDVAGVCDQPYGTDGSTDCELIGNHVYRTSGAPYSGAILGANSGSTGYVIANNIIYGLRGGIAIYCRNTANGGLVHDNIVNGGGYTPVSPWNMIKIDTDCVGVIVHHNKLTNPPTSSSVFGRMMVIATGNDAYDNTIDGETEDHISTQVAITEGAVPGPMKFERNHIKGANKAVDFEGVTDNGGHIILMKDNEYDGIMTTAYTGTALVRNAKVWFENERYLTDTLTSFFLNNMARYFLADAVGNKMPFRFGRNIECHFNAPPSSSNSYTLRRGDTFWHSIPAVGSPVGWIITASGTYGAETDNTGDTDGSTAVVTGMTDTSDFFVGDFVSASAGFATTGPFEILAKTSTTVTLDTASNSAQSNITVATIDPVVTAMANL